MPACVSARASGWFSVTAAGVSARALDAFCEKPCEWAMSRLQPNPARAMLAMRRLRPMRAHDTAEFRGREEPLCSVRLQRDVDSSDPAKLDRETIGVAETQPIATSRRKHRDADGAQF